MYKFSRVFFVLFVLLTVLPVFLLIIWNVFSFQEIERNHITFKINEKISRVESDFRYFLSDEKKFLEKLVDSTKDYNISLGKYREILGNDQIWWIDSNKNGELEITTEASFRIPSRYLSQNLAYYDLVYNPEKQQEELVAIFIILTNVKDHKGLAVVSKINYRNIKALDPPTIVRIYTGKEYNPANILYDSFGEEFFGEERPDPSKRPPPLKDGFGNRLSKVDLGNKFRKKRPGHGPPTSIFGPGHPKIPPLEEKLSGKQFVLKNYNGKQIATVNVGMPNFKEPFWVFPNPLLAGVFEKFYLIGALIPVLGLILSIFAGMYLKKYILNPIEDLSNVSKIVINGDLTKRVNEDVKQPEIKDTLKNFNKMLSSTQEKEELQRSFVANLTHDFRTPLLAENRTIELLLDEFKDASKPEQIDLLESLLRNNEHLLEMVNLLLENYKFESGKLKLNLKCTHIENILNQCFKQLKTLAEDKNIELNSEFEPGIPEIIIDKNLIKRSFINLIINALENIPKNSKIIVSGKIDGHNLQIKFWDNGPGISKDDAEKLFERYYTGNHTERKIGSGLGLYICRKFIEAHGGYITVNTEKGEYSEFIVTLPITRENLV